MKIVEQKGSVRVDLLGGTIDLPPIHMILPNVVTLNVATSLQAHVKIQEHPGQSIIFESLDYKKMVEFPLESFDSWDMDQEKSLQLFQELQFVGLIVSLFRPQTGMKITLESGSPAGAGLGGSSAMGITLFRALARFFDKNFDKKIIFSKVTALEAKILNRGPAGYQDYFPALYGGILALRPVPGEINVEQLFSTNLKNFLESHATLIYSGETRQSGINNWEVYKKFFDGDTATRNGLKGISELAFSAYKSILSNDFNRLPGLLIEEGKLRSGLFPNILIESMKKFEMELVSSFKNSGVKVCGAGGGGCFLALHEKGSSEKIQALAHDFGMKPLPFLILGPEGP